jgi:poly [ADP-ribose] polymerase 2/3/4
MSRDRFFCCAVGETANRHSLRQIANDSTAGGLCIIFDPNYRSRWKSQMKSILEHLRQPCVTNIHIDWEGQIDSNEQTFVDQAPRRLRSLFNGMRLTVYRFIRNCHRAVLTARINDQEFVTNIFANPSNISQGQILHSLTAKAIIQDYENGFLHIDQIEEELFRKQKRNDLIRLSSKYSVVSSLTSFVAIEERDGQPIEPGLMKSMR